MSTVVTDSVTVRFFGPLTQPLSPLLGVLGVNLVGTTDCPLKHMQISHVTTQVMVL